jgi:hypothetical protein
VGTIEPTSISEADERFARAKQAGVVELYANGFVTGLGMGDVYVVLERNGNPAAILNMSYTVAKTLAAAIGNAIAQLEEKSGREMLTTNDLVRVFSKKEDADSGVNNINEANET